MQRRLPITNQGKSVLVAISLPPLPIETNRHNPSDTEAGRPTVGRRPAAIADTA